MQDSVNTADNVQRGNKELKQASEKRSQAQMVFYATVGLCTFLTAWDLIF
jgi:syntaxin 18